MDERNREGTAATLRAAGLIVVAGICLGLAFNALGLASRPPRGLPWIKQPERLPSLEELQPGSSLIPVARPRAFPGFALVGTAWAGGVPTRGVPTPCVGPGPAPRTLAADTARATAKKPAAPTADTARATVKKPCAPTAKSAARTTKGPVKAAKNRTQPVKPAIQRVGAGPGPGPTQGVGTPRVGAPAAATTPAPAKVDLPVVPDLDQPIEVKLANVKKFYDAGAAVIVDAREATEYAEGHIPGALSVPLDDAVAKPALLEPFKKAGKPIIAYCSGGDCEESKDLAKNMLAEGIRKVLVFTDGYPAWKAAGYPVEKGAAGVRR